MFECQFSLKCSNPGVFVIGITSAARHFALWREKVASINAHVFPPSDSQSASETLSWEPVQSVEKPSIALVVTSNTLQNAASMPWSFKGGKISNKQPPRQQLQSVHTVT